MSRSISRLTLRSNTYSSLDLRWSHITLQNPLQRFFRIFSFTDDIDIDEINSGTRGKGCSGSIERRLRRKSNVLHINARCLPGISNIFISNSQSASQNCIGLERIVCLPKVNPSYQSLLTFSITITSSITLRPKSLICNKALLSTKAKELMLGQ